MKKKIKTADLDMSKTVNGNETASSDLVQINSRSSGEAGSISRRGFLKFVGAASAVGAVGCADSAKQKILPHAKGQDDQIPGVATWFQTTCKECSAGCGLSARNIDGRTIKVEGNPLHPINKGGVCGLGQASLQALYDPDRVRQPMRWESVAPDRTDNSSGNHPGKRIVSRRVLKPISWKEAYQSIATAVKKSKGDKVFFTGELTGSLDGLLDAWSDSLGVQRVTYDALEPVALAKASELVYGKYGVPRFNLEKAEVLVNFGADFLETWVSPCELARQWADARRGSHPLRVLHIEPRLSLTGANADSWYTNSPGSELQIALVVLKLLLEWGKGQNVNPEIREKLVKLVGGVKLDQVAHSSGIGKEKILVIARHLFEAKRSLVLAGGASAQSSSSLELMVVTAFLNLVLSNVGSTVDTTRMRQPKTDAEAAVKAVEAMREGKVDVVFTHGTNPAFSLPAGYGFDNGMNAVGLKVAFSSHVDETAELADIILPTHHFLEDWGDDNPYDGVHSLVQPSMTPLFDTQSLGDMLLKIAGGVGKKDIAGEAQTFEGYLKNTWKELYAAAGAGVEFEEWFRTAQKSGGYFPVNSKKQRTRVTVNKSVFGLNFSSSAFEGDKHDPVLLPFSSVKSFDGRAANRPWLQELPDPITQIVWDSWVEVHPETAKKSGLKQGDIATVRNAYGELNLPVFVTDYVHPDVVAVPLGQGHTAYGRYAKELSAGGNVYGMIPPAGSGLGAGVALTSGRVSIQRSSKKDDVVISQGSDLQYDRELARTSYFEDQHDHGGHSAHGHSEHHEPKQMFEQRLHPLYEWGLAVDLAACTGCSACVVACYSENAIPVVGKKICGEGREMSWLRIERYYDPPGGGHAGHDEHAGGQSEELQVNFLPMMCQHCNNAPCEVVCPVYATYHNEEGLNVMAYNRCVGTRYCSNNCSYKVRRYNWFEYDFPEPMNLQVNPDVTKRSAGVMEKCTFCIHRIAGAKDRAKDVGRLVEDGEVLPACVQSCPTQALTFGDLNDPESKVSKLGKESRAYKVLDHHLNTQPSVTYLDNLKYRAT